MASQCLYDPGDASNGVVGMEIPQLKGRGVHEERFKFIFTVLEEFVFVDRRVLSLHPLKFSCKKVLLSS